MREQWQTRTGFIVAAAGSAVGLGNIWKFPYMAGENGGAAFILIYLVLVFTLGFSVLMAEQAIGRATQHRPVSAFRKLKGGYWPAIGFIGVLTAFIILPFYSVVGGWTLGYIWKSITGVASESGAFGAFISNGPLSILFHALFMGLTIAIVIGGVRNGIERWSRILMPLLLVLLVVLAIRGLTLPGSEKGIEFYFTPDFSKVTLDTIHAALAQAFFSLSVGMGVMITYGSYMSRERPLAGDAGWVVALDSSVAILAGLVILPAVFAFGMDPKAGPSLTFITLPAVFAQMPGGAIFGVLFFLMLSVAALTSAISLLEVVTAHIEEEFVKSRKSTAIGTGIVMFLMGIPAALSFGAWSDFKLFGMTVFDLMDFLATKIMLPVGALGITLFVGWVVWARVSAELNGEAGGVPGWAILWRAMCAFIAPALILWILLSGLFG